MREDKKKRVIQPVSFNITDHYEEKIYQFALEQQKYFSRYVKNLIVKDMESKRGVDSMVVSEINREIVDYVCEDVGDSVEKVGDDDILTFI